MKAKPKGKNAKSPPKALPSKSSERRSFDLAAIVESFNDAIFGKDLSGTIISWNQGAERLYGYSAAEIIGKPIATIIPPEVQEEGAQFLKEIAEGRLVTREETVRRRKDGSLVHVSLIISPVRDLEGRIVGASTIAHDITGRKRAEEALRESQQRLDGIIASAMDSIITLDEQQRIVLFNAAAERMFRCSAAEAMGQPIERFIPERFRSAHAAHIRRFGETGVTNRAVGALGALWAVRADGEEFQIEASISQIESGGKKLFTVILRDVTERTQAEEALRDQAQLLDSAQVFVRDLESRIVLWPRGAEKLYGFKAREALGIVSHDLFHTQFPEPLEMIEKKLFGTGMWEGELTHRTRDGRTIVVSSAWVLHRDSQGRPVRILETNIDITARKRVEERLREYERVVEGLEEMILVVDREYRYVIANRTFLNYRGMEKEQVVGRSVQEILSQEAFAVVKNKLDECFQGKVVTYELTNNYPKLGERDLLVTYFPIEGPNGVDRAACILQDITKRKRAEEALRRSEQLFSKAFRSSPLAVTISTEAEGRYLDVNGAFLQMIGYKRRDVIGRTGLELRFWTEPSHRIEMLRQLAERGRVTGLRTQFRTSTGEIREADVSAELIELDGQKCMLAITRDITETLRLEAQFRQAQKMEAVGRLAGGVAHDLNNILGVIIGYGDLSRSLIAPESPVNRHLEQIKKASNRAVTLTQQLLAFSRQQVVFPRILDVNEVVQDLASMLRRMVGEDVAITFQPTTPIGSINADPGQVEQVLMNLVVNARDAMPSGGKIIIETGHAELDEHFASHNPGSRTGQYVVLTVTDTGCGMDENIKSQIFEPFFTTKGVGEGTGLGLSTVYGIVKQSGSYIWVYSSPGKGTTFKIYFPRVAERAEEIAPPREEAEPLGGSETILVVEDDESLRELVVRMLQDAGYRVIEADDAETALDILQVSKLGIDLLLTDVIMPGKTGGELLEQAKVVSPTLRSLFMSGYAGDLVALRGGLMPEAAFLEKPFTRTSLLRKVYSILHGESAKQQSQ